MRALLAVLLSGAALAACSETGPDFGEGGWEAGDVEEAVPLRDAPEPMRPPPPEPPARKAAEPQAEPSDDAAPAEDTQSPQPSSEPPPSVALPVDPPATEAAAGEPAGPKD